MKKIKAFKCEFTEGVYEDEERARKSEFMAMMKDVGNSLPAMGSINPCDLMQWLGSNIYSGIYPPAADRLSAALDYYKKHRAKK